MRKLNPLGIEHWKRLYAGLLNRSFALALVLVLGFYSIPIWLNAFRTRESDNVKTVEARVISYSELSAPPPIEIKPPTAQIENRAPKIETVKFVQPVVKKDHEVTDETEMPSVSDLRNAQPSTFTQSGTDSIYYDGPVGEQEEVAEPELPIYSFVEKAPEYVGGMPALTAYLRKNLQYPQAAREMRIQGVVILQFVVEADGSIQNIAVARGVSSDLDQEAIRVLEAMPPWQAGEMNGRPVRVRFTLPIRFTLMQDR